MTRHRKSDSLSTLLLGDTIAGLAEILNVNDDNQKIMAILIGPGGVKVAIAKDISRAEAIGALYQAIECVSYDEY